MSGQSDEKRHATQGGTETEGAASEAHASTLSQPGAEAPIDAPEPFTELENLYAENAALKEKVLRAMAEAENVRRRAEREVSDAKLYGVTNFAREMLAFAENLRRAVESVPANSCRSSSKRRMMCIPYVSSSASTRMRDGWTRLIAR